MNSSHRSLLSALFLSVIGSTCYAVHPGVSPTVGPVINPFTAQETQVWKLVGKSNGCSAFQFTPAWVMSSAHCPAGAPQPNDATQKAHYYTNDHIAPLNADPMRGTEVIGATPTCETVPANGSTAQETDDIWICRLDNPGKFVSPVPFPPLVAGPFGSNLPSLSLVRQTGAKYGSLMLYGRAGPDHLAFMGFNGLSYGFSPITDPAGTSNPALDGGDSGGALIWFSPTTSQPAITGIVTTPLDYLTEPAINWIRNKIAAYGDVPPATMSPSQHFGGPTGYPAQELDTRPVFGKVKGATITLNWAAPSAQPVSSYKVTLGHNASIDNTLNVTASASNSATFTIATGNIYTACVQAINAIAPANLAWVPERYSEQGGSNWAPPYEAPNCQLADLRIPGHLAPKALSVAPISTAYTVSTSWSPPATPNVSVTAYRVTSSLALPTGPKRTSTIDQQSASFRLSTTAGSTVCMSVAAISVHGVLGPFSATQCIKTP